MIYILSNLKFLEERIKTNNNVELANHSLSIDNLIQKYNELRNSDNFHSTPTQPISTPYLPYHPQSNVSLLTVISSGWTNCYLDSYSYETSLALDTLLKTFCTAPYLMLACKKKSSKIIDVLAWGGRKNILFNSEMSLIFTSPKAQNGYIIIHHI